MKSKNLKKKVNSSFAYVDQDGLHIGHVKGLLSAFDVPTLGTCISHHGGFPSIFMPNVEYIFEDGNINWYEWTIPLKKIFRNKNSYMIWEGSDEGGWHAIKGMEDGEYIGIDFGIMTGFHSNRGWYETTFYHASNEQELMKWFLESINGKRCFFIDPIKLMRINQLLQSFIDQKQIDHEIFRKFIPLRIVEWLNYE